MTKKAKILVADDDRFMREMIRIILARGGYDVVFAEDGATAVELAASEKPDLVLTDGLLPKMHGFLVCKTIKEFPSPPKVILVTAVYTKPTYKWEVKKEYGADDIVRKPFKGEELLACIEKHLAGSETESAFSEAGSGQAATTAEQSIAAPEDVPALESERHLYAHGFSAAPAV